MCLKIYHLDPAKFLSALRSAWSEALKWTKVELQFLSDIDMLLMVEKELDEEYVTKFMDIQKLIAIYMIDYDKNKESSYLKYWDVNNFYGWVMSQKLPVNGFEWVEDISEFDESFIKSYNE